MSLPVHSLSPMLGDVAEGLAREQKELPPKYFYDRRGSELFEEITRLPEYYLTRAERGLLRAWSPAIAAVTCARTLVELGAGSAEKTRLLLDAMRAGGGDRAYAPVDVSAAFLEESATRLRREYPGLRVAPIVADMTADFTLPRDLPRPVLHAFLGSTIGNFAPDAAVRLLRGVRARMTADDRFLIGADLRKEPAVIEAAYNDSRGVTAAFNLNMLRVLNRELGADFDEEQFEHRAFYDRELARIEMHLVSRRAQTVRIPGIGAVRFAAGETLRTEISCKHDRASIDALLAAARLRTEMWWQDDALGYALLLARPR